MRHFWLLFALAMILFTVYSVTRYDTIGTILGAVSVFASLIIWYADI